jgi:hypothetical protein
MVPAGPPRDDGRNPGAAVTNHQRQPLRIETHHEDRVVVLGCDSCRAAVTLRTNEVGFDLAVQAFFLQHADCETLLDLKQA